MLRDDRGVSVIGSARRHREIAKSTFGRRPRHPPRGAERRAEEARSGLPKTAVCRARGGAAQI